MFTHRSVSKVKANISSTIKTHLLRGAFYMLLLLAVYVIPFALAHRQSDVKFQKENPSGFVCFGCPSNGWHTGPDMPSTAVRTVGVYFWPNGNFYAVGGRSMDGVGNDFTHPFEFNLGTNSWSIKSATYPDNQVSDMACGILTDSGTNYIYCVGGSAGGQTTATDRVFRYNPITDTIETIPSPWPGNADGITLPGGFVAFNNKLYILGGFRINTEMIDAIWEFTPGTNTWMQKAAHLPVPLGYIPTTAIFSLIYTGGGSTWDGTTIHDSNYSFVYDPTADSISTIANIPRATGETRALTFAPLGDTDYEMWVMGGGRDAPNPSSEVDTYEIFFHRGWSTFGSFLTPRRNFAVDGEVSCNMWLAGGYGSDGTPLSSMEFFCFPAPTPTATATFTPTPTATPTPTPCTVTSPLCGLTVFIPPTDFQINLSAPVDPSSVQASDLTVNGIPADSAVVENGNTTIDFIFNLSPTLTVNTIHISAGAFDCGPPVDFNCTFFFELIPPPTPTATPTPRSTPPPRPRPSPRPRPLVQTLDLTNR
jgi:hypothetical protein